MREDCEKFERFANSYEPSGGRVQQLNGFGFIWDAVSRLDVCLTNEEKVRVLYLHESNKKDL